MKVQHNIQYVDICIVFVKDANMLKIEFKIAINVYTSLSRCKQPISVIIT